MDQQKELKEGERVVCLSVANGKVPWSHEYPVAFGKVVHGNGPWSMTTVHDGRVYSLGALGHLHCLDADSCKVLWADGRSGRAPTRATPARS